jgi:signal transduction histidine kinase
MKPGTHPDLRSFPPSFRAGRVSLPRWIVLWLLVIVLSPALAADNSNPLEIRYVQVNGKSLPFQRRDVIKMNPYPENIVFGFGRSVNAVNPPVRMRYLLEGFENSWREDLGDMGLTVRFYNNSGDQISQSVYTIHGESTGWTGSLKNSLLTHRRETLVVPPQASRILIVISSAGPPDSVGIYVVANLIVSKSGGSQGDMVLLKSPFENETGDHANDDPPPGWMRDGTHPSLAKIIKLGQDPQTKAFAIIDDDLSSHGEWHNVLETAPTVLPGDNIVVEWNETYSIGLGNFREARYNALSPGNYKFRVAGVDVMGKLTGNEAAVNVSVSEPFWRTPWFWAIAVVVATFAIMGISRYFVWHRMRREMIRLKQQRALEQERLRIAHDIHDDLGARVTQISLLSAMAQDNPTLPEKARLDFDKISQMSRELISALYETVWAVNPENDNLEALGNYLCQMVNKLCERTQLRCRFHVVALPQEVQVSSQTRHNISMAVKEAVHNIIKHAKATEINIRMSFSENYLEVSVQDDGVGFNPAPADKSRGNGLTNMQQRLAGIGGRCTMVSRPGQGTTVQLRLAIKRLDKST